MHIKKTLIILVGLFILFAGVQTVFAADAQGLNATADAAFGAGKYSTENPSQIIGNVIGAILTFVGVLFLVLMIYGGIIWMLARGNEQQSKKALDTIIAAVIGLVIVLGSYALTNFVFSSVSGGSSSSSAGTGACYFKRPLPNPCTSNNCTDQRVRFTEARCTAAGDTDPTCCEWR